MQTSTNIPASETKGMNLTQRALLASILAPIGDEECPEGGSHIQAICEYKALDAATRFILIEKALVEDCKTFNSSLDKFYQPALLGEAQTEQLEVIRALKIVNDLCFNNEVKKGIFGTEFAHAAWFARLGPVDSKAISLKAENMIVATLGKLQQDSGATPERRGAALLRLNAMRPQQEWRRLLDLPVAQQPEAPLSQGFFQPTVSRAVAVELVAMAAALPRASSSAINGINNPIRSSHSLNTRNPFAYNIAYINTMIEKKFSYTYTIEPIMNYYPQSGMESQSSARPSCCCVM